jgi:hypothetical protein
VVAKDSVRACPYCREEIPGDATRCRHCGSAVVPETPGHEGKCPFCLSQIDPKATICRYCRSYVGPKTTDASMDAIPFLAPPGRGSWPVDVDQLGSLPEARRSVVNVGCTECVGGRRTCVVLGCSTYGGITECRLFTRSESCGSSGPIDVGPRR